MEPGYTAHSCAINASPEEEGEEEEKTDVDTTDQRNMAHSHNESTPTQAVGEQPPPTYAEAARRAIELTEGGSFGTRSIMRQGPPGGHTLGPETQYVTRDYIPRTGRYGREVMRWPPCVRNQSYEALPLPTLSEDPTPRTAPQQNVGWPRWSATDDSRDGYHSLPFPTLSQLFDNTPPLTDSESDYTDYEDY